MSPCRQTLERAQQPPVVYLAKVAHNKFYAVGHAIELGVVARVLDRSGVDVNGNDALAAHGQLDGIAADAAERVDDGVHLRDRR